jgi:asparagine synthase (glutamine-hydrolysing)
MCGLLAYLSTDDDRVDDTRVKEVHEALHCLRHRGPDETQVWHDARVAFGFNRLSFIDIEHSHQPMPYADDRYRIVFNGEIYNYVELREELAALGARFATEGDTEAIVAATTTGARTSSGDCAACSRSSSGTPTPGRRSARATPSASSRCSPPAWPTARWSSAPRRRRCWSCSAAATPPGGVDSASLQHYLTLQYVPEPATLHRGIRRIESGTSFTVADGELHTSRYFHPTFPVRPVPADEQQGLYDRIAEVLDDSVRVHMRADVTVGSFLSGGIDSTAIAALAKRYNPDLMTFTVGFEREGYSRSTSPRSRAAIGVRARHQGGHPRGVRRVDPAGRLVPSTTRSPTPPSCRCTSWPARRAST